MKLVAYEPYYGLTLTELGQKRALKVVRYHRLVELFLSKALGLPWDQVHVEAEKWEHVLSEEVAERIAASLGQPTTDPHGAPIPTQDGLINQPAISRLIDLKPDQAAVIAKVSDHDSALLRYLGEMGFYPGVVIRVIENLPFAGSVRARLGEVEHTLGHEAAQHIFVTELLEPAHQ